jgi:hypothetical protein
MKNKLSKPINESSSSNIDIVDSHTSNKIRKSKRNKRANILVLSFISFT